MKLSITALLLTALAATEVSATHQEKCQKKNGHVVQAIQQFCGKTNLVVPSNYAVLGAHVGTGGPQDTRVYITGTCSPAQWVPQKYCLSQFYALCAGSPHGSKGDSQGSYGRHGCQNWNIDVGGGRNVQDWK
ncbi:hypothetical protein B0A50_04517 [Salinomyces thailandicus]|uniref:Uncharacterized protein n=1 Tax=Salinomyces thailandicus TaxID=706561 RepID=A0A4U0TXJ3_9PEZI|nr:hypothetical protein B0A50_04517 [Salinomyces thailandica]